MSPGAPTGRVLIPVLKRTWQSASLGGRSKLRRPSFPAFCFFLYAPTVSKPLAQHNRDRPLLPRDCIFSTRTHRASVMARSGRRPACALDRLSRNAVAATFFPLGFAHSSRTKKVACDSILRCASRPYGCVADRLRPTDRHRGRGGSRARNTNRRRDMATIGSFKEGRKTISRARSSPSACRPKASRIVAETSPSNDKAPSHRVFCGPGRGSAPLGRSAPRKAAITSRSSSTTPLSTRRSTRNLLDDESGERLHPCCGPRAAQETARVRQAPPTPPPDDIGRGLFAVLSPKLLSAAAICACPLLARTPRRAASSGHNEIDVAYHRVCWQAETTSPRSDCADPFSRPLMYCWVKPEASAKAFPE